jgi:hypothetical protein
LGCCKMGSLSGSVLSISRFTLPGARTQAYEHNVSSRRESSYFVAARAHRPNSP